MMSIFELDAFGPFPPERIRIRWTESEPPPCDELEREARKTWDSYYRQTREQGTVLFNGPLVRLVSADVQSGTLVLDTCPTDYIRFMGTNMLNPHLAEGYGWQAFSNPIGTSALAITTDDYLILGRRSEQVASHRGCVHTFGGAIEPDDRNPHGEIDVYGGIRRELEEELFLDDLPIDPIRDILCLGLTRDASIRQPEMIFDAWLDLSLSETEANFDRIPGREDEHTALVALKNDPDAILPFIRAHTRLTPIAISALCIHGRYAYGEGWYNEIEHALKA